GSWARALLGEVALEPDLLGPRGHVAHGRLRRLLHHLAETAGDEQLALARHHLHLGAEQLATQVGPREARRHADALLDLGLPETEAVRTEVVGEALRRDADARLAVP